MKCLRTCVCGGQIVTTQKKLSEGRGKFCSKKCQYANATRPSGLKYTVHKDNPTSFKRGFTPWNKGTKTGLAPWNKGVKGLHLSPATEFKYKNGNGYRHLLFRGVLPQYCEACLSEPGLKRLHVHHKDRNRGNNNVSNLEVLCRPCHLNHHNKQERVYVVGRKAVV